MTTFTHTVRGKLYDDERGVRRFRPHSEQEFKWLFLRGNPGDEWIIGARPYRAKHTPNQRGYLRGVVVPEILRAMGMEDSSENNDAMYYKLKEKFAPCVLKFGKDGEAGEVIAFPKSARDMDTQEMSQLIDGAIRWAAEFLNLTIPPPERVLNAGDGGGI